MQRTIAGITFTLLILMIYGAFFSRRIDKPLDHQRESMPGHPNPALPKIHDTNLVSEYGPLTKTYTDAAHSFSLQHPASFIEGKFPEWNSIVDNDTKAQVWLGLCPPGCTHIAGSPFSHSKVTYTQDHTITSSNSPDIPLGEGRRVHVLSSRQFITAHGTHALEQQYEVTGFEVVSGKPVTLFCGEDTPCKGGREPGLRYVFFSEGKAPYVIAVRTLFPHDRHVAVVQAIAETVSY